MTKRIASTVLALVVSLSLATPAFALEGESPFIDVPLTHWAVKAIAQAQEENIIQGVGGGAFDPDGPLTAAQFAAVVTQAFYWRILNGVEAEPDGAWSARYQKAAEQAGLTDGTGIEDWNAPMTRYQMAQMLYNIAIDKEIKLNDASSPHTIADLDQIPEEYQEAVNAVYGLKLLSGVDEQGTFAGNQTLTRAQAAVVFVKLDQAMEAKDGPMERALDKAERAVKRYSFLYTEFTRYPGRLGTAYYVSQGGTPHGTNSYLNYVARDGTVLDIRALLPEGYVYGSIWSFPAKMIRFDETGEKLSFVVRVYELEGDTMNVRKDWGDTQIVVNVAAGEMESMEPLAQ